jgi:hypothetical protein
MKRLILICAALVLVQAGLVVLTHFSGHSGALKPGQGVLFPLNAAEVNELLLEDGAGQRLVLKKENDRWLLPEAGSFPADTVRVQELIERLAGMQRGWPEATTAEAASRFKVARDRFERKLSLRKDGTTLGTVYFGTSPGLRKVYLRVDNDPEIQTLALAQHELEVKVDNWIDTAILHLKLEQITRAELPGLQLERTQDGLQPADLNPEEEVVKERRDALVKRLASLTVTALLGSEQKPEYGLDNPALRYTVHLGGGVTIDYLFGQAPKAAQDEGNEGPQALPEQSFVLKVSNQEQLFRVDGWQVEEIKNATRAALVRIKTQKPLAGDQSALPSPAVPDGEAK